VDVADHFLRAEKLAKQTFPDAELTRIHVVNMSREGIVDMEISGSSSSSVFFSWRSPERSKPPPGLPLGAKHKAACTYIYLIHEVGIMSRTADHISCEEPTIPRPRCSLRQVLAAAEARGAPSGNYIATLSYFSTEGNPPRWYVSIGEFNGFVPDEC
jgi:hypothetical protein